MIKFRKPKNEENFLLYVPVKKHLEFESHKGRVALIFHHDKPVEKFVRWIARKPRTTDVTLDETGSRVWKLIDGNNTVYDIGQELIKLYGDSFDNPYDRLIMYIRYLNRRGWIYFKK